MPQIRDELIKLQECAAFWAIGAVLPESVIEAARNALEAGIDGPMLRRLAGGAFDDLDEALAEHGISLEDPAARSARFLVARGLAKRCLAGEMTPRALAAKMLELIGRGHEPELEALVRADDEYDTLQYTNETAQGLNERVLNAARKIVGG